MVVITLEAVDGLLSLCPVEGLLSLRVDVNFVQRFDKVVLESVPIFVRKNYIDAGKH